MGRIGHEAIIDLTKGQNWGVMVVHHAEGHRTTIYVLEAPELSSTVLWQSLKRWIEWKAELASQVLKLAFDFSNRSEGSATSSAEAVCL